MDDDFYTVGEAARVLKVTEPRIRQLLLREELEGHKDPVSDRWKIPQHAVHARLESHRPREELANARRAEDWMQRVAELERELGRMEGRLELTSLTESTIKEQLARAQEEADRERARAERLEQELKDERARGFWARLFGAPSL